MNLENIYMKLPPFFQSLVCSAYGWRLKKKRYGGPYSTLEKEILSRGNWTWNQLEKLSRERLQAIVVHAATTVPFYRQQFQQLGLDPKSIRTPEDLALLPILTKQIVQQHLSEFISDLTPTMSFSTVHTSGTTGAGLIFPVTIEAEMEQWAIWWRYRNLFCIGHGTWYAHFYGKTIMSNEQSNPPFWRVNWPGRQILFSAYHMSEANLPFYLNELNRRQPPWIQGYPSLLVVLANFILECDCPLTYRPQIVTVGAESLLPHQKMLIEKAFGAPCRQHYGMTEGAANISECPEGNLHVDEDYSRVEFVPLDGCNNSYRIIGTGYANYAFPLLRYDTGDIAELEMADKKCPCGHSGRLVKSIDGRIEDYVMTPDNRRIGRMDHIFKDMINIRECQIYQDNQNAVVFRIVRGLNYSENDEKLLYAEARKRLGNVIKIELSYVDSLDRTSRGKLRFVVSKLNSAQVSPIGEEY